MGSRVVGCLCGDFLAEIFPALLTPFARGLTCFATSFGKFGPKEGILRGRVLAATPSRAQRSRRGLHARALAHAYAQPTHPDACLQRWRYSVDPTIRRGKWTVEEDGMLRQGVA
eukprot:scaffold7848_cov68-Phaeocystis_antarctica.AAC.1